MRGNITASFAVGWDSKNQIHQARKMRQVVIGEALGYLLEDGSDENARFASTVLDAMGFCNGAITFPGVNLGNYSAHLGNEPAKEINFLHKLKAKEIYAEHLAKPFMTQQELNDYLFEQTLSNDRDAFDLLTKTAKKEFNVRL